MKNILHPDYWAEVSAGECQLGLTDEQQMLIWLKIRDASGYATRPPSERAAMDQIIEMLRHTDKPLLSEPHLFISILPKFREHPGRIVEIPRFYIARFPIIEPQFKMYRKGAQATSIPGTLEIPEVEYRRGQFGRKLSHFTREAAPCTYDEAIAFAGDLGGRIPTKDEWEKAARGTDGRLYPWGNEWDETCGYFYSGQRLQPGKQPGSAYVVDGYPKGQSPYGVWNMAGCNPEYVTVAPNSYQVQREVAGQLVSLSTKGVLPRETGPESAHWSHVVALDGYGHRVTLRPVLDEWPRQQWTGVYLSDTSFPFQSTTPEL
jgi:formylglycine-generating enzyme required for sulfatase activity